MEWLRNVLSTNGSPLIQYAVTFAVIFAVLAVVVLLVRRAFRRSGRYGAETRQPGRRPRLGIVDVYELDKRRQLVLLRRDGVEHLLLVGGPNDLVVESRIERTGVTFAEPALEAPEAFPERQPATEPRGLQRTEPSFGSPVLAGGTAEGKPTEMSPGMLDGKPQKPNGLHRDREVPGPGIPAPGSEPAPRSETERHARATDDDKPGLETDVLADMARQLEAVLTPATTTPRAANGPAGPGPFLLKPKTPKPATTPPDSGTAGDGSLPVSGTKAPDARPPAGAVPATPAKGSPAPFSVEEIEAEFARLLGRTADRRG